MITCVNNRKSIDENSFVSDCENFIIEADDGRKFLYKKVLCHTNNNDFTYMRIYERLGKNCIRF